MNSKINTINLDFTKKHNFQIWYINVRAQKIDGCKLNIFDIVIASFFIEDKDKIFRFFEAKSFFVAIFNINIILGVFFLTLSNVKINVSN